MTVNLSKLESLLSRLPDKTAASDLVAEFICTARRELRDQERWARLVRKVELKVLPAPLQKVPERKGGNRLSSNDAAKYVQHCRTDFSALVQMEMIRPDNPDAPKGSAHVFCEAALNNFLNMYPKTERTRRLKEFKDAKKAKKAAADNVKENDNTIGRHLMIPHKRTTKQA